MIQGSCGSGNPHTVAVRGSLAGECGDGGYRLSVGTKDANGFAIPERRIRLGGGPKRKLPPWIGPEAATGPLLDDVPLPQTQTVRHLKLRRIGAARGAADAIGIGSLSRTIFVDASDGFVDDPRALAIPTALLNDTVAQRRTLTMDRRSDRRRLLAGLGVAGAAALVHAARPRQVGAATLGPSGPRLQEIYDKIARTSAGLAEARTPVESLPSSATAQYVISAPGVYYLTANVIGVAGKSAIEITSDHVELECDCFNFIGVQGTLACIRSVGQLRCIAIFDAGFRAWQHTSIDLSSASDSCVEECWFDSCDATSPVARGTCALGPGGVVFDSDVRSCHAAAVTVGENGIIEECTNLNGDGGCFFSPGPAVMEDNFAMNNAGPGIKILSRGVVIGNRLVATGGIDVGAQSVVSENDIDSAPTGITVRGPHCSVEENYVAATGGTAISVLSGAHNAVIDGNQASGTATAVVVDPATANCLIVRNSSSGGGSGAVPFIIPPGNAYGPIVDVAGQGDMSSNPTTAHPWANFAH